MTNRNESLPRAADELEALALHYGAHDTSAEMDDGVWVEPVPMVTTSLRLPADIIEALKDQARTNHVRYTAHLRSILEQAARRQPSELARIAERLDRIERAVTGG